MNGRKQFTALMVQVGVKRSDPSWTAHEIVWDKAWHAARAHVLETAALIADNVARAKHGRTVDNAAARSIAARIRALAATDDEGHSS
ncbi:hypothetical protein [Ralstonia syzygii]|uniref:hypothetical protein n=1 Tax=Ralstonia syzygii TaxID=28097 RepID=UPI0018D10F4D|nr:hypothetical protein [Ralstonia syzygii]